MRHIQATVMLLGVPVVVAALAILLNRNPTDPPRTGLDPFDAVFYGWNLLLLVTAILAAIDTWQKVRRGDLQRLTTAAFTVKICAIPFFLLNFAVMAMVTMAWALLGGLVIGGIAVALTYLAMLGTSVYGWGAVIVLRRRSIISPGLAALYTIMLFVFVLDVAAGIGLYVLSRRALGPEGER